MPTYLAPKKRLIPLLVVSIIFLLAVLLVLFSQMFLKRE